MARPLLGALAPITLVLGMTLIAPVAARDYADLARLGHVTRARATQVMNLLNLAPDTQPAILFLPRTPSGRDPVSERKLRRIAAEPDWRRQRRIWCSRQAPSVD